LDGPKGKNGNGSDGPASREVRGRTFTSSRYDEPPEELGLWALATRDPGRAMPTVDTIVVIGPGSRTADVGARSGRGLRAYRERNP